MLYEEGFTQNREISWLRYNERVLEEALDDKVPLFERLRFIAIFNSNLEEFFRVRVGGLIGEDEVGDDSVDKSSGMDAAEQLRLIHSMVPGLLMKKDMAYASVEGLLAEAGIVRLEAEELSDEERGRCFDHFRDDIKGRLVIRLLSSEDSLPELDEERPYIAADLDAELEDRFGLIDIPGDLPSVFVLDDGKDGGSFRYMLTEDIIKMFADTLFVPFVPKELYVMDIARNAEAAGGAERASTAAEIRRLIKRRKNAQADRLIADAKLSGNLREYLKAGLGIDDRQIFTTTRIDFSYLDELSGLIPDEMRKELMYEPHAPFDQTAVMSGAIMDIVKRRDILSFR